MNPIQMLQNFIARGLSPQKIVEQMAGNNPMMANLIKMVNSGDTNGVENFARNMFKEKEETLIKSFLNLEVSLNRLL